MAIAKLQSNIRINYKLILLPTSNEMECYNNNKSDESSKLQFPTTKQQIFIKTNIAANYEAKWGLVKRIRNLRGL